MSENNGNSYKPYIPADKVVPELTVTSIILGILLAVVFGAANAYLGLRVGMTISASIPAAVLSMGVIRFILRKDSILENNMVQTIGSAGESLSAGIMCGGIIRWIVDRKTKKDETLGKEATERGTLFTSGLIAGEGLMGILLAVFAVVGWNVDLSNKFSLGQVGSLIIWVALLAYLLYICLGKNGFKKNKGDVKYGAKDE